MPPILGLDVGTTKVAALIGRRESDAQIHLLGFGCVPSEGMSRAVVVDIGRATNCIAQAVRLAEQMAGVKVRSAVIGITGAHISSLNSKAQVAITRADGEISREDVDRVEHNATTINLPPDLEIISAIPRGFVVDGQSGVNNPVGLFGRKLEVETHIIVGMRNFARNLEKCVQANGLDIIATVVEPVATSEAVLCPDERNLGVVLLDIGGGTTDVAVFNSGAICFTGSVPLGGYYVTRDVAAGLRSSLQEAERLKIEHGSAAVEALVDGDQAVPYRMVGTEDETIVPKRILAEIIEARMTEIFQACRREVFKSPYYHLMAGGIVISGGGSLLPNTGYLASRIFDGLPVRIGRPPTLMGVGSELNSPIFATAVGLMLCTHLPPARELPPLAFYPRRIWNSVKSFFYRLAAGEDTYE